MKKNQTFRLLVPFVLFTTSFPAVQAADEDLRISFDKPTSLSGRCVWYNGKPELWKNKPKPISAGDRSVNPDSEWESQSLPLGNGSIGANILGSVEAERITFNEKTLWRGGPNTPQGAAYYWNVNKESAHYLKDIRQAFTDGDTQKAAQLTRDNFNSVVPYEANREKDFRFGSFTTMGEFYVETGLSAIGMTDYNRSLSLDSALVTVSFSKDGVAYRRQSFISYPDNVMVIRFSADKPGKQNLTWSYAPSPVSTGTFMPDGDNGWVFHAKLDNNGMEYAVRVRACIDGGTLNNRDGKISVNGANEVTFYVTADTDYKMNFNPDFNDPKAYVGVDPMQTTSDWMQQAVSKGFQSLLQRHYADYSNLFGRVKLSLCPSEKRTELSTPARLAAYRHGAKDAYLEELYYQYGRYLLIASSRAGNMPANLQGIWHNNVDGPWRVDYHNNINIQMNYWPACSTALPECVEPLVDFIRTLIKPGERTAKSYFGARGWTASISANIFGFTSPLESKDMSWNFNPMAGPWLATHIWDYYDYTRDKDFLGRTGYSILKESALFVCDYLWHKPDGTYTAAPSTSPEHGPIDQGATFVHAVVREVLLDAIAAAEVLKTDKDLCKQWKEVLDKLAPYQIGRYGQLMEWSTDIDNPKDNHRHVNHLFGLHPGHTISPITTPELSEASKVVLQHRGDGATGWSMGWKLNQWARLHDGNHAYVLYGNLLKNGTLDNLWDTHAPFQIDGNFGGTAGVTEMLLQSHAGFIHLLPALPDRWKDGTVSGLYARGNFEVDMTWSEGSLDNARIQSHSGGLCTVYYQGEKISFKTQKGKTYTVSFANNKLSYNK